jgi:hypothetical protein
VEWYVGGTWGGVLGVVADLWCVGTTDPNLSRTDVSIAVEIISLTG